MKMLQTQFVALSLSESTLFGGEGRTTLAAGQKNSIQLTHQVVPRFRWFSRICSDESSFKKKQKNDKTKKIIFMCQKEFCFPIPSNKFAQSMKQKKARELMGIFTYGSHSP